MASSKPPPHDFLPDLRELHAFDNKAANRSGYFAFHTRMVSVALFATKDDGNVAFLVLLLPFHCELNQYIVDIGAYRSSTWYCGLRQAESQYQLNLDQQHSCLCSNFCSNEDHSCEQRCHDPDHIVTSSPLFGSCLPPCSGWTVANSS